MTICPWCHQQLPKTYEDIFASKLRPLPRTGPRPRTFNATDIGITLIDDQPHEPVAPSGRIFYFD